VGSSPVESLETLHRDAIACRRCALWQNATQTIFGEGPDSAELVFVGEQPGDQEDREGRPFVGPAGTIFNRALAEAGIDRTRAYVTNAVKHFKNEPRGKRRIHQKPNVSEVKTCRWWLEREIGLLHPTLTVALGATAAYSLFGKSIAIRASRRMVLQSALAGPVFVTVHPSSLLRQTDAAARRREYGEFVGDLRRLKEIWQDEQRPAAQPDPTLAGRSRRLRSSDIDT
jgi:DNA polymerase